MTLSCSSLCCVRKQLVMCAAQVRQSSVGPIGMHPLVSKLHTCGLGGGGENAGACPPFAMLAAASSNVLAAASQTLSAAAVALLLASSALATFALALFAVSFAWALLAA